MTRATSSSRSCVRRVANHHPEASSPRPASPRHALPSPPFRSPPCPRSYPTAAPRPPVHPPIAFDAPSPPYALLRQAALRCQTIRHVSISVASGKASRCLRVDCRAPALLLVERGEVCRAQPPSYARAIACARTRSITALSLLSPLLPLSPLSPFSCPDKRIFRPRTPPSRPPCLRSRTPSSCARSPPQLPPSRTCVSRGACSQWCRAGSRASTRRRRGSSGWRAEGTTIARTRTTRSSPATAAVLAAVHTPTSTWDGARCRSESKGRAAPLGAN